MKKKSLLIITALSLAPTIALAATLDDPLGSGGNINLVIGRLVQALLGVVGALALLMFVWGGFQWLTSMGSPDKVKKGKDTLIWAAIGIAIIMMAYTLVRAVVTALQSGTI